MYNLPIKVVLSFLLLTSNVGVVQAVSNETLDTPNFTDEEIQNLINQMPDEWYEEEDEGEIVYLYDEEQEIDVLDSYLENIITPFGWENEGDVGSGDIQKLRDAFSKIVWLERSGVWSLSLTPKNWYETTGYNSGQMFNVIAIMWAKDYYWNYQNMSSMRNQFMCHWDIARTMKTPWNIEPSKADRGSDFWIPGLNTCN